MVEKGRVCVTGGGGFQASWLLNLLLSKGYTVHATVRNPDDEKNAHLKTLENASEKLLLFKADLLDYDSLFTAIKQCSGVFHVASPVLSDNIPNPEREILEPAVTGTLNVLKACSMAATVKRVVIVSSISAVFHNPKWPKGQPMDESSWSDKEFCKTSKFRTTWYDLAKTMAERQALEYGKETGLDVVSVCPSIIIGPMLQSKLNATSFLIYKMLKDGVNIVGNNNPTLVDVRDVAEALLLVYEKTEAEGRYICCSHKVVMQDLVDKLKSMYPKYKHPKKIGEVEEEWNFSSEKLQKLGWRFRSLEESIVDSVKDYQEKGLLEGSVCMEEGKFLCFNKCD